jgi:glutathione S-transferase
VTYQSKHCWACTDKEKDFIAVDHDNGDFPVFESGAIMMYLAEKAGQLYPSDYNKRAEVNQWLFFMNAGIGPMQGQANHFVRYAPEKIEYAQNRYVNETYRLYDVLESRLEAHQWLAADEYTIAVCTRCLFTPPFPFFEDTIEY